MNAVEHRRKRRIQVNGQFPHHSISLWPSNEGKAAYAEFRINGRFRKLAYDIAFNDDVVASEPVICEVSLFN